MRSAFIRNASQLGEVLILKLSHKGRLPSAGFDLSNGSLPIR
jgi:hypothetical protein